MVFLFSLPLKNTLWINQIITIGATQLPLLSSSPSLTPSFNVASSLTFEASLPESLIACSKRPFLCSKRSYACSSLPIARFENSTLCPSFCSISCLSQVDSRATKEVTASLSSVTNKINIPSNSLFKNDDVVFQKANIYINKVKL